MGRVERVAALFAMSLVACAGAQPQAASPAPPSVHVPPEPSPSSASPPGAAEASTPGTRELVAELAQAERIAEPERRWYETRRILAAIRALADPRGADALAAYVASPSGWPAEPERVHRRTLGAFALAELGDLRALPVLAARLGLDPLAVYRQDAPGQAELRRSDEERVVAARLIAELAALHPGEHERIRAESQEALRLWLEAQPAPHANGLRALARMQMQDQALRQRLRAWADPPGALPKPGAMPPFDEKWVIAQSALRYAGALRDEKAWPILEKQLARRPKNLDVTTDSLISGGIALVGMTVRALAVGAASGFAEWGDARAVPHLLRHIEDEKQNEHSRAEACRALGMALDAKSEPEIGSRLGRWRAKTGKTSTERVTCLLEALRFHPVATLTPQLLELSLVANEPSLRLAAARALGHAGLDPASESELLGRLASPNTRLAASVALLLGGQSDAAERAVLAFPGETNTPDFSELGEAYLGSLDLPHEADLDSGRLFRFVRNARRLLTRLRGEKPVDFAVRHLATRLADAATDSGPRSLTRVLLRKRLADLARSGRAEQRESAVDTLELLGERGVLLALATGSDSTAKRAAQAASLLRPTPAP